MEIFDLGVDFPILKWLKLQDFYWAERVSGNIPDCIFFAEHEPVYTSGARTITNKELLDKCFKKPRWELPCKCADTKRGGLATYQGPGILSVYFIFLLKGMSSHEFSGLLLSAAAMALNEFGVEAKDNKKNPGLYTGRSKKIVSIGLQISRGVSRYGIAISLDPEEKYLKPLIPCGLDGVRLTSLAEKLGASKIGEKERTAIKNILAEKIKTRT